MYIILCTVGVYNVCTCTAGTVHVQAFTASVRAVRGWECQGQTEGSKVSLQGQQQQCCGQTAAASAQRSSPEKPAQGTRQWRNEGKGFKVQTLTNSSRVRSWWSSTCLLSGVRLTSTFSEGTAGRGGQGKGGKVCEGRRGGREGVREHVIATQGASHWILTSSSCNVEQDKGVLVSVVRMVHLIHCLR